MTPSAGGEEHPPHKRERFARIKRAKTLLRFVPRRAVMHKYPFIGRFAAAARKRAYLWSFKPSATRPAIYAGSILSLLPLMGVQLPLALLAAILLRANFMVLGGLQFITNPFTAAPIYYATHQIGISVIHASGFGRSPAVAYDPTPPLDGDGVFEQGEATPHPSRTVEPAPEKPRWSHRFGTAINALILGGIIVGGALGVLLDILYRNMRMPARRQKDQGTKGPKDEETTRETPDA